MQFSTTTLYGLYIFNVSKYYKVSPENIPELMTFHSEEPAYIQQMLRMTQSPLNFEVV